MTGVLVCVALTAIACLLVALNEAERPFRPHREHRDETHPLVKNHRCAGISSTKEPT